MLVKLKNIHSISVIQQSLTTNVYGLSELEFEDKPIGAGGVGSMYKIINIDGKTVNGLLAKIVHNVESAVKAYETISILHNKINNWQLLGNDPLFLEYPELCGLPFMAFKGEGLGNDDEITVFLTYNLNELGFQDFDADNWDKVAYSKIELPDKLMLCYQYVKAANFLHELKFIHADLKDESLFINLSRPQLAIIDFDGGYNFDKQGFALTIGAINRWATPKWLRFIGIGRSSQEISTDERLDEENWVMANAIFELMFSVPPFFFLKDSEEQTISSYLKKNKWPYADADLEEVNIRNLSFHKSLLEVFRDFRASGLDKFMDTFEKIFNSGYKNPSKRLNPLEWKRFLETTCEEYIASPDILDFVTDKKEINSTGEIVKFSWNVKFATKIHLNNVLQDLFSNNYLLKPKDECDIEIRAKNDFGETIKTIHIQANKVDPQIYKFSSNTYKRIDHAPVTLSWSTNNCKEVRIDKIGTVLPASGDCNVNPHEKTKYILTAVGFFDQQTLSEVEIDVVAPSIIDFRYEINIERGIDNVDLFWKTEDAIEVKISPRVGNVELSGNAYIGINERTDFTITAKGSFNEINKTIQAQPFPIPIIKGIFVPTPIINITSSITLDKLQIPQSLLNSKSPDFNLSIKFDTIEPNYTDLDYHLKKMNELPQKVPLLNSLFNKIFKPSDKN